MPAVTALKRSTMPFFKATAPVGELASVMISGSSARSSGLHDASTRELPSANTASRRELRNVARVSMSSPCVMKDMVAASERHVETEDEVRRRRGSLEVGGQARAGGTEVPGLRIDAGVLRDDAEVAAGHRRAEARGAEPVRPLVRESVGRAQLTQPDEVGLEDVTELRRARRLANRHSGRLLLERGGGVDDPPAIVPALAADPLRIELRVSANIRRHQSLNPELPI